MFWNNRIMRQTFSDEPEVVYYLVVEAYYDEDTTYPHSWAEAFTCDSKETLKERFDKAMSLPVLLVHDDKLIGEEG
jgi:hypothetical protein